jgi:hypothetical protein
MAKLVVAFRNFANAPKICSSDLCVKERNTPNAPQCYVIRTFVYHLPFLVNLSDLFHEFRRDVFMRVSIKTA